jgi:hypothetical protein
VREVLGQNLTRVVDDLAVAREEALRLEREDAFERGEILREISATARSSTTRVRF